MSYKEYLVYLIIGCIINLSLVDIIGNINSKYIINFFEKSELEPVIISIVYLVHLSYAKMNNLIMLIYKILIYIIIKKIIIINLFTLKLYK